MSKAFKVLNKFNGSVRKPFDFNKETKLKDQSDIVVIPDTLPLDIDMFPDRQPLGFPDDYACSPLASQPPNLEELGANDQGSQHQKSCGVHTSHFMVSDIFDTQSDSPDTQLDAPSPESTFQEAAFQHTVQRNSSGATPTLRRLGAFYWGC